MSFFQQTISLEFVYCMLVAAPYAGGGGMSAPGCDEAGTDEYVKPAEPSGGGGGG